MAQRSKICYAFLGSFLRETGEQSDYRRGSDDQTMTWKPCHKKWGRFDLAWSPSHYWTIFGYCQHSPFITVSLRLTYDFFKFYCITHFTETEYCLQISSREILKCKKMGLYKTYQIPRPPWLILLPPKSKPENIKHLSSLPNSHKPGFTLHHAWSARTSPTLVTGA